MSLWFKGAPPMHPVAASTGKSADAFRNGPSGRLPDLDGSIASISFLIHSRYLLCPVREQLEINARVQMGGFSDGNSTY